MSIFAKARKSVRAMLGPDRVRKLRGLRVYPVSFANSLYDFRRYYSGSSALAAPKTRLQMRAKLIFDYHKIEKGLALPDPRPGFGKATIRDLIRDIGRYDSVHGRDDISITVRSVLRSYQAAQANSGTENPELSAFLANDPDSRDVGYDRPGAGGALSFTRESFFPFDPDAAERFLTGRHSVRNMTGELIPEDAILKVVRLAQCAPSVCNRQSGRLYVSTRREVMDRLLSFQNGNRGFGHTLGAVFVVASDLESFVSIGERNQPFVDGGIFAMALVQGLHASGLGACMLNWSAEKAEDLALRRAFGIPDTHAVITMVGAGYVADEFKVSASPRIPSSEVITWLK